MGQVMYTCFVLAERITPFVFLNFLVYSKSNHRYHNYRSNKNQANQTLIYTSILAGKDLGYNR